MNRLAPVFLAVAVILASCALVLPEETRYLQGAQGRDSQDQVMRHLGRPLLMTAGPKGSAVWVYQFREQEAGNRWTSTGLWCDEYVLTFDDQSILRGWTHQSQFHGGELMPTYCVPGGATAPMAAKARTEQR